MHRFDIAGGHLSTTLTILARQSGADILFSAALVGTRSSRPLHGKMSVETALATLLAGSNLSFHRTADGAFVINATADTPVLKTLEQIETIPEILVIGKRAQNSDIRRSEDDIQPYMVSSRREIEDSHSGNIEDFTRTRLPANSQIASPAQNYFAGQGSTRSQINLRGLGPTQTLVLVDGRRMPSVPGLPYALNQPDINGIPLNALDRIETLTATAGGIYGPGATSGMINLILRRDYRGAEASVTTGLTTRGDAPELRLEGRIGFSPDHGRTEIMIEFSRSRSAGLRYGARDFYARAQAQRFANDPIAFLASNPVGNAINVIASQNLVLDPQYGGAALGSRITSLPLGLNGDVGQRNALLIANAGSINLSLPNALGGQLDDIVSRPSSRAILANARHRFGSSGIEAFVDVIDTQNDGRLVGHPDYSAFIAGIAAASPTNPFQQSINVSFPLSNVVATQINQTHVLRYTAGLTVALPRHWSANVEYTGGLSHTSISSAVSVLGDYYFSAYAYGQPLGSRPALDPLGSWADFVTALKSYRSTQSAFVQQTSHLSDATFRLAGPLIDLPGGKATLTLLAEMRSEHVDATSQTVVSLGDLSVRFAFPRVAETTRSLSGELRVPLSGNDGLLRKLELQIALRDDRVSTTLPASITLIGKDPAPFINRHDAIAYTAGARFTPIDAIMLRASVSTGILPPSVAQIGSVTLLAARPNPDPQRGGRPVGSESEFSLVTGGSASLRPERARSLSVGFVLKPFGDHGVRVSADFTRIDKHDEIGNLPGVTIAGLLSDETRYPDRIGRAPLTAADAALGFSGGIVTRFDLTTANIARSRIDALDVNVDYPLATMHHGIFRFYLNATWEPSYWQQSAPGQPRLERVSYSDGPLEGRANGGIDWSSGSLRLGLNGQFYSRYRVATAASPALNGQLLAYQGSAYIPAQLYVDLSAAYRFADGPNRLVPYGTQLRFGIINLLDHRPPTVTDPMTPGYSYYGDPRRRRVELTIAVPFGVGPKTR